MSTSDANFSAERIAVLVDLLTGRMNQTIGEIGKINDRTRLLSFNAQIEAARAGQNGAAFGVVAGAIRDLSEKTAGVAGKMASETQAAIGELQRISKTLVTNVRGVRLADLALNNIELIDRNLYERSCDVRWWATDSSVVDALLRQTPEAHAFCSRRLAVILNAYTVYLDLVLCDQNGRVVANGRPERYASVGTDCGASAWFQAAQATGSGEEFGFEGVHESRLVDGRRALIYSCAVRSNGAPLGVLGIVFDWDGLAQTIVQNTPLTAEEKEASRVCIVDDAGRVLADSSNRQLLDTIDFDNRAGLFGQKKAFTTVTVAGRPCCVAHAASPGYETYATGWHVLILQPLAGGAK